MHKIFTFIFTIALVTAGFGQTYDPLNKPNTYRNSDNPYYWKNRPPYPGYWQQDVYYQIKANIDESTDIIEGQENLTYWNNSPDELKFVYFHLYQNAFQPESYLDQLQEENGVKAKYGKYEKDKKGTEIIKLTSNGTVLKTEYDNTIVKVFLAKPLKAGESVTFDIDFKTYFDYGSTRRRMKAFNSFGFKHYDGVHWYPRISVYDAKFGWDTQQHLGKEFYGDFGAFDVELTFSDNFVVEATGNLTNNNEVLPDELRDKLDIANFKNKPWNSAPSVIIPYDKLKRKTWKYHAENVHDFAFTADPTYRIDEFVWSKVKVVALVQEPHASRWLNAAQYTGKVIKTFSRDFGMYAYPKMIVADARDGMEYPMLTLDGGEDPGYRSLFAHEVGHNWFFGMVGNNETYRAMLDEGFTQFLTAWACISIDGDTTVNASFVSADKEASVLPNYKTEDKNALNYAKYLFYKEELNKNLTPSEQEIAKWNFKTCESLLNLNDKSFVFDKSFYGNYENNRKVFFKNGQPLISFNNKEYKLIQIDENEFIVVGFEDTFGAGNRRIIFNAKGFEEKIYFSGQLINKFWGKL